jgi:hypothetical protein
MTKLSAWLSIAVGVVLGVAQLIRNWGNWEAPQNWMTWGVDIFAALALIAAGLLALRGQATRLLSVAWAFAGGLYVAGLLNHLIGVLVLEPGPVHDARQQLAVILSGLLVVVLGGLGLALFDRRRTP